MTNLKRSHVVHSNGGRVAALNPEHALFLAKDGTYYAVNYAKKECERHKIIEQGLLALCDDILHNGENRIKTTDEHRDACRRLFCLLRRGEEVGDGEGEGENAHSHRRGRRHYHHWSATHRRRCSRSASSSTSLSSPSSSWSSGSESDSDSEHWCGQSQINEAMEIGIDGKHECNNCGCSLTPKTCPHPFSPPTNPTTASTENPKDNTELVSSAPKCYNCGAHPAVKKCPHGRRFCEKHGPCLICSVSLKPVDPDHNHKCNNCGRRPAVKKCSHGRRFCQKHGPCRKCKTDRLPLPGSVPVMGEDGFLELDKNHPLYQRPDPDDPYGERWILYTWNVNKGFVIEGNELMMLALAGFGHGFDPKTCDYIRSGQFEKE